MGQVHNSRFANVFLICLIMNPENIYYLFEVGIKDKQEDYIWPVPGKATVYDKVFMVCDGAGSFYNGGIASRLICQFMATKVLKFSEQKMSGALIDKLLLEARIRLVTYARENRLDTDLATTFSMLILYDKRVLMSWYGDSRIYHLRGGEILATTEAHSLVSEPIQNDVTARTIKTDNSPIHAETKWIEDVQDGDYFLLCSKGIFESVTDEDIRLLISRNDKENIDLTGSFRRLAFEKGPDNYSMYLIRVNAGKRKRSISRGINAIRRQTNGIVSPIFILAMTIVGLFIMVFYFRSARTSDPALNINQTTQSANGRRVDSVPNAIVKSSAGSQSVDVLRDDSVPSAIVMSAPRRPVVAITDSVKDNSENPMATPQDDISAAVQTEEKQEQTIQAPISHEKPLAQLRIRLTTDESCKLKITNTDLDEVIDWDLSPNDNGTLYLKLGKYSIVATSVTDGSKSRTYKFDVKPGTRTTQNIHIRF